MTQTLPEESEYIEGLNRLCTTSTDRMYNSRSQVYEPDIACPATARADSFRQPYCIPELSQSFKKRVGNQFAYSTTDVIEQM